MPKISARRGLCSTCKNDPTCTYPRDSGRPVMQCEEFEGELLRPPETAGRNSSPSHNLGFRLPSSSEGKHSNKYLGLCRICDDRETCTFPKLEGGVWHCDEYR